MSIAATSTPTTTTTGRRAGHIALWVLQVLLAAVYVMSAAGKLFADPVHVAGFEMMGLGNAGMYLVGTAELLGAIGLLVPRIAGAAALALVALMVGAVVLTLVFVGAAMAAVPAAVLVAVAVVAWGRRRSTAELVALVRR